ncbi:hypothetical protein QQ008_08615 [Fulvivirgaceae bacterium BMA10]|uniref:Uncharacterized protein n=1 Tax=Splendidivirga corallicola TaxID=3051826 RepID=A0ABT8KL28_9BACT|nr:hypothetical protein [Fulvivirgaceae bacterium BMA10]
METAPNLLKLEDTLSRIKEGVSYQTDSSYVNVAITPGTGCSNTQLGMFYISVVPTDSSVSISNFQVIIQNQEQASNGTFYAFAFFSATQNGAPVSGLTYPQIIVYCGAQAIKDNQNGTPLIVSVDGYSTPGGIFSPQQTFIRDLWPGC